ncbi:unnamed protein product, partial [Nesidiocoris tenuis]
MSDQMVPLREPHERLNPQPPIVESAEKLRSAALSRAAGPLCGTQPPCRVRCRRTFSTQPIREAIPTGGHASDGSNLGPVEDSIVRSFGQLVLLEAKGKPYLEVFGVIHPPPPNPPGGPVKTRSAGDSPVNHLPRRRRRFRSILTRGRAAPFKLSRHQSRRLSSRRRADKSRELGLTGINRSSSMAAFFLLLTLNSPRSDAGRRTNVSRRAGTRIRSIKTFPAGARIRPPAAENWLRIDIRYEAEISKS